MPDLNFAVEAAEAVPYSASPLINLKIRIKNNIADEQIQSVILRCQIQLEVSRRQYTDAEKERLMDLFGEPERWGQTLRTMLWTNASVTVPPFAESTIIDLPVPCTFDFNIAATKYFAGLDTGEVPVELLFSGTVFYKDEHNSLQIWQIPWEKEAKFRLPITVWQKMMEFYYPNTAWVNLRRDVFERLLEYKTTHGIPTFEQALEKLLPPEEKEFGKFAAD